MKKQLANMVTGLRILGSAGLLLLPAFSVPFYIVYLLCGLSDMADGMIARGTNAVTAFGSNLDSAADLIFVVFAFIKLFPTIHIPVWLWLCVASIGLLKLAAMVIGLVRNRRVVWEHTVMNKITGGALFLLPLTVSFLDLTCSAAVVCVIAAYSAIQDFYTALLLQSKPHQKTDL